MEKERAFGKRICNFSSIPSTNEFAKSLVLHEGRLADGTVVIAEEQTSGRGRLDRAWLSLPGGIYMSLVQRLRDPVGAPLLNLLSALPVADVLRELGLDCRLKWPNDLMVGGRKIGGILGELVSSRGEQFAVIGMGLNSNIDLSFYPEELRASVTSIKHELGRSVQNPALTILILERYATFLAKFSKGEADRLLSRYRSLCSILGEQVVVKAGDDVIEGQALNVARDGSLVVMTGATRRSVLAGDVRECRPLSPRPVGGLLPI